MKNGFFTEWIARFQPNDKQYYEKDPELNGSKLTGKYKLPLVIESSNSRVLVDVGAAQGYFSTRNHEKFDRIYCFEPCYPNFRKLARNIQENPDFSKKIAFFNYAIGSPQDSFSFIDFNFNPSLSPYGSTLYKNTYTEENRKTSHRVPVVCLEDIFLLINEKKIDVLKCDVEGAEYDFLIEQDLSSVDILIIEFHKNLLGKDKVKNLANFIVSQGFSNNLNNIVDPAYTPKWIAQALEKNVSEFTLYNTNNSEEIQKKWVI